MKSFKVQEADAGLRADIYIAKQYPGFSRSSLGALFDEGLVILGNRTVRNSYKVKKEDVLKVDDTKLFSRPKVIDLSIIYEDKDVVVIDKPAGVLTHAKGALNNEPTVANFIKPMLSKDIPDSNRAGIVHRLDRLTSGVIITAKNPETMAWLQKQFSSRKTKKSYTAVVEGEPNPSEALIDAPITRHPRRPQTFHVNPAGKPAQTEYKVIKTLKLEGNLYSLVELKPLTGRTHQLRVHLAYLNHPIVGDPIYGNPGNHMYLHARQLDLTLPSGERKMFTSDLPKYFKELTGNV